MASLGGKELKTISNVWYGTKIAVEHNFYAIEVYSISYDRREQFDYVPDFCNMDNLEIRFSYCGRGSSTCLIF